MKTTDFPVIVEQIYTSSIEDVWNAITQHHEMTHWFFEQIPDFKAEVGFKTQFNVQAPSRDFLHLWKITDVIPLHRIVYNWKYQGLKGNSFVIFELTQQQNLTKLILTTNVIEDFDDNIPEFQRGSCQEGWSYFIKDRLVNYLKDNK